MRAVEYDLQDIDGNAVRFLQFRCPVRPRSQNDHDQLDLFRAHFDQLLNPDHPLVILAQKVDWARLDAAFAEFFITDMGVLPPTLPEARLQRNGRVTGRALSGESLLAVFLHPTTMTKWRKRVGTGMHQQRQGSQAILCLGNPYDGHTLQAMLAAAEKSSG
jgi:hypothetical protein